MSKKLNSTSKAHIITLKIEGVLILPLLRNMPAASILRANIGIAQQNIIK